MSHTRSTSRCDCGSGDAQNWRSFGPFSGLETSSGGCLGERGAAANPAAIVGVVFHFHPGLGVQKGQNATICRKSRAIPCSAVQDPRHLVHPRSPRRCSSVVSISEPSEWGGGVLFQEVTCVLAYGPQKVLRSYTGLFLQGACKYTLLHLECSSSNSCFFVSKI